MFGIRDNSFRSFTADGKKLFGQCVDWAAGGCCGKSINYGTGVAGQLGIPTLTTDARPVFGATINVMASNSSGAATAGLLLVGQQPSSIGFLGGTMLVNPVFLAYLAVPGNGLVLPYTVPNNAALCGIAPQGLLFYLQVLQTDPAAMSGVSFTPGLKLQFGH